MKVLLIDVNCKQGSTGKIVYDLYQHINGSSNDAMICYGRGDLVREKNIIKFSSDIEMFFHALTSRVTGLNGYFSPIATHRLIREIKRFKPDIVHIHDPKTYYMNIGTLVRFLARNNIPIVWTFHSEYMYTGKCGYANECLQWKTHCKKCPQLSTYPKSFFFDFTNQMFEDKKNYLALLAKLHIVSPSKWLAERVKESFLKGRETSVVSNGINVEIFHRRENDEISKQFSGKKVILAVAPDLFSERKGGKYVLKLARQMKNRKDIHFVLIGCDESPSTISHSDNVTILPRIYDQKLLAEYYSVAAVFLICSYRENFPTTSLEAQCCGAPVVGFNTGGTQETAVDEHSMRLVPYGDIEKLQAALEFYLAEYTEKDHSLLSKKAVEAFSPQKMFQNYYKIYKELLA